MSPLGSLWLTEIDMGTMQPHKGAKKSIKPTTRKVGPASKRTLKIAVSKF